MIPIDPAKRDAAIALIRSTTMPSRAIAEHVGLAPPTVLKIINEIGAKGRKVDWGCAPNRAMPADFPERAKTSTNKALIAHYKSSAGTIKRWREECGVALDAEVVNARRAQGGMSGNASPVRKRFITGLVPQAVAEIKRDMSRAGLAASFMQRDGWVCHRCTADGRAMPGTGSHWRLGRLVVTDAELIERAERKGFGAERRAA